MDLTRLDKAVVVSGRDQLGKFTKAMGEWMRTMVTTLLMIKLMNNRMSSITSRILVRLHQVITGVSSLLRIKIRCRCSRWKCKFKLNLKEARVSNLSTMRTEMILLRTCLKCATMSHLRCIKMIVEILKEKNFMAVIKLVRIVKANSSEKMANTFKMKNIMTIMGKKLFKMWMKENTSMKNIMMIMAKKLFRMMKAITMRMISIILMIAIIKGTIILTIIKTRLMKMKMSLTRVKNLELNFKRIVITQRWQKMVVKHKWILLMKVSNTIKFLKKSPQKQKINTLKNWGRKTWISWEKRKWNTRKIGICNINKKSKSSNLCLSSRSITVSNERKRTMRNIIL